MPDFMLRSNGRTFLGGQEVDPNMSDEEKERLWQEAKSEHVRGLVDDIADSDDYYYQRYGMSAADYQRERLRSLQSSVGQSKAQRLQHLRDAQDAVARQNLAARHKREQKVADATWEMGLKYFNNPANGATPEEFAQFTDQFVKSTTASSLPNPGTFMLAEQDEQNPIMRRARAAVTLKKMYSGEPLTENDMLQLMQYDEDGNVDPTKAWNMMVQAKQLSQSMLNPAFDPKNNQRLTSERTAVLRELSDLRKEMTTKSGKSIERPEHGTGSWLGSVVTGSELEDTPEMQAYDAKRQRIAELEGKLDQLNDVLSAPVDSLLNNMDESRLQVVKGSLRKQAAQPEITATPQDDLRSVGSASATEFIIPASSDPQSESTIVRSAKQWAIQNNRPVTIYKLQKDGTRRAKTWSPPKK